MMKNFRVVSVSAMMAAFATSSWAACPTTAGWSENGGELYYVLSPSESSPITITMDEGKKSFKLCYNGSANQQIIANIVTPDENMTVSVTGGKADFSAGTTALVIKNWIDFEKLGVPDNYMSYTPSFQSNQNMYKCANQVCNSIPKKSGLNALQITLVGEDKSQKSFELTVQEERYDFGPMQVFNIEKLDKEKLSSLAGAATFAGFDLSALPVDKLLLAIENGLSKVALLNGKSESSLYGLSSNIPVDYVYLDRTFAVNEDGNAMSTITLPFNISTDYIDGAWEILQFTRIGKDGNNNDAVFMKKVYCAQSGDKCPATNGTLKAYKPYIVQLKSGVTSLEFVNSKEKKGASVTLKATTMEAGYADFADPDSWWVFRGVFEKITWDKAPANTYGYAASGKDKDGNDLAGKFVKVGAGAYIYPFRGVLTYAEPLKAAPANSSYALRPNVLPDEMNIVVEGDNNETTVIGSFNTRTGKMKFINNLKHTYDLKGRRVNGVNNARGAYYGKKVMR